MGMDSMTARRHPFACAASHFVSALAIFMASAAFLPAATVVGSIQDVTSRPYGGMVNQIQFTPLSCPQAIGTNTVWPIAKTARLTNGVFSVNLVGGLYYVGMVEGPYAITPKTLKILVDPNATNELQLNYCANLATNVGTFVWTNRYVYSVSNILNVQTVSTLDARAVSQVKNLVLNTSGGAFMATNSTVAFVRTNGDDGTGFLGNTNYPFATIGAAISTRTNLIVDIGPGTFPVTNQNLGFGLSIIGAGTNSTFITMDTSGQKSGLIVASHNVFLKDFTIGTNTASGIYYFPISVSGGISNLVAFNVKVLADSDCVFANPISSPSYGEFYYCDFSSGFDCLNLTATVGSAATNSLFSFYNCKFNSTLDTNFTGIDVSCLTVTRT